MKFGRKGNGFLIPRIKKNIAFVFFSAAAGLRLVRSHSFWTQWSSGGVDTETNLLNPLKHDEASC